MAESKGALIAKTVQKHAGRAKEKVSTTERHIFVCTYVRNRFPRRTCQSTEQFQQNCALINRFDLVFFTYVFYTSVTFNG